MSSARRAAALSCRVFYTPGFPALKPIEPQTQLRHSPILLHVETSNPTRRLYARLGFLPLAGDGIYLPMAWTPPGV